MVNYGLAQLGFLSDSLNAPCRCGDLSSNLIFDTHSLRSGKSNVFFHGFLSWYMSRLEKPRRERRKSTQSVKLKESRAVAAMSVSFLSRNIMRSLPLSLFLFLSLSFSLSLSHPPQGFASPLSQSMSLPQSLVSLSLSLSLSLPLSLSLHFSFPLLNPFRHRDEQVSALGVAGRLQKEQGREKE